MPRKRKAFCQSDKLHPYDADNGQNRDRGKDACNVDHALHAQDHVGASATAP